MLKPQKIVSIRKVGVFPAMDLEIDSNDHLFLADGCVVSNSHAVAYASIGYICQYLKTHYALEWYCSVLKNERDNDKLAEMYQLFKSVLLMPEINRSNDHFHINDDGKIVIPLNYIMRVGDKAVEEIVRHQPFDSLQDFVKRVSRSAVRKDIVVNLIFADVFRELEKQKGKDLLEEYFSILAANFSIHSAAAKKLLTEYREKYCHMTRFDMLKLTNNVLPGVGDNYVDFFRDLLPVEVRKIKDVSMARVSKKSVMTAGLIVGIKPHATKKGETMAFLDVEDGEVALSVLLWPNKYDRYKNCLKKDDLVVIEGKTNIWGDKFSIVADKITVVEK